MGQQSDRLLTDKQACQTLNISRSQFWRLVKLGVYPPGIKLSERTRRWRESDIQKIVAEGVAV